jgi:PIN domain nuclease of toxin-antitoxin system
MKALLDTHTFLWWITDQPHLPQGIRTIIDRMLIAQTQFENIPILTSDNLIARYPVEVVWS